MSEKDKDSDVPKKEEFLARILREIGVANSMIEEIMRGNDVAIRYDRKLGRVVFTDLTWTGDFSEESPTVICQGDFEFEQPDPTGDLIRTLTNQIQVLYGHYRTVLEDSEKSEVVLSEAPWLKEDRDW